VKQSRNSELLAAAISKALAEARLHGSEVLLSTSPPGLRFDLAELRTILAALNRAQLEGPLRELLGKLYSDSPPPEWIARNADTIHHCNDALRDVEETSNAAPVIDGELASPALPKTEAK
jgi:hypothetical protein